MADSDELLRSWAEAVRQELRRFDLVARLGGDEFAILLPETPAEAAREVLHRLLARHTEDVCIQAARRLETFVDSQLAMAGLLARDWSQGAEGGDRMARFERLAGLILTQFPSFHTLALLDRTGRPVRVVSEPDSSVASFLGEAGPTILGHASLASCTTTSDSCSPGCASSSTTCVVATRR